MDLRCEKKRKAYAMKKKECFRLHFEISVSWLRKIILMQEENGRADRADRERGKSFGDGKSLEARSHTPKQPGRQQTALSSRYNWIFNCFALSLGSLDRNHGIQN
jgi:hypothetical protein